MTTVVLSILFILGDVPLDINIRETADLGKPIVVSQPDNPLVMYPKFHASMKFFFKILISWVRLISWKQSMCFKEVSSRILDKLPKQEGVRWQWSTSISHVQQTMYQQQLMANIKTCFSLLWCSGLLHSNKKFSSSLVSQWNLHECWVLMHNKDGRQWF